MGSTISINPSGINLILEKVDLSCLLDKVLFERNIADNGGAIAFVRAWLVQLDDVQFVRNKGLNGGAMFIELDGDPHPQIGFDSLHCANGAGLLFKRNAAEGGWCFVQSRAVWGRVGPCRYFSLQRDPTDRKYHCQKRGCCLHWESEFIGNNATESGGAWHVNSGRVGCLTCNFSNNSVEGGPDAGGGAITLEDKAVLHARNVKLIHNTASHGGGIDSRHSILDIAESCFIENVAK